MRQEITNEIKQAFDTDLADAVKNFTIVRESVVDDDWASNGATVANTIITSGRGVFMGYSSHEIDGQTILQNDVKLLCLQAESEKPMIDDVIEDMQVVAVSSDAADVSWVVQLRGHHGH